MYKVTYKSPRLIEEAMNILSFFFICRPHRMCHGSIASTKSAVAEITVSCQIVISKFFSNTYLRQKVRGK
jgi:hypothetical protein